MIRVEREMIYPAVAVTTALLGAAFDLKSRRIPNFITGPALLLGLSLHLALDGWRGLLAAFAAVLLCGAIFLLFYLAGGMGAGDVKLIAAVGCIAGVSNAVLSARADRHRRRHPRTGPGHCARPPAADPRQRRRDHAAPTPRPASPRIRSSTSSMPPRSASRTAWPSHSDPAPPST